MRISWLLLMMLGMFVQGSAPPPSAPKGNAALLYYQAFLLNRRVYGSPKGDLDSYGNSIALVRRAASIQRCDWGSPGQEDPVGSWTAWIYHESLAKDMVEIMARSADVHFEAQEYRKAIGDIEAGLALSRRIFRDAGITGALIGISGEERILAVLKEHLSGLPKDYREELGQLYSLYGGWMTSHEAIETSARVVEAMRDGFEDGRLGADDLRRLLRFWEKLSPVNSTWDTEDFLKVLNQMYAVHMKLLALVAAGDMSVPQLEEMERRMAETLPEPLNRHGPIGVHTLVEAERDLARRWQVILGISNRAESSR